VTVLGQPKIVKHTALFDAAAVHGAIMSNTSSYARLMHQQLEMPLLGFIKMKKIGFDEIFFAPDTKMQAVTCHPFELRSWCGELNTKTK